MSFDYATIKPITRAIRANRQAAKRHYGVHPYFTRRPPNVVRSYILHYSRPGDRVLDPFGGSGVTAIEAFLENRHGIQNDINPLGNFIAENIADLGRTDTAYIEQAFRNIERECRDRLLSVAACSDNEVEDLLRREKLPKNIALPSNSDVENFHELFTRRQLLSLAILKNAVDRLDDEGAKGQLLLAWSATCGKLNRTFLSAKGRAESRGGSSVFSIYRYKVAKRPVELPAWQTFDERVGNIVRAKQEVLKKIEYLRASRGFTGVFERHSEDVRSLPKIVSPVDYIFTDPPYGGHIAYLDLSTIWNHWLGFRVPDPLRRHEIIVGGELNKSEDDYISSLRASIKTCFRLLKPHRWMSVVFQHWNTAYFEAILEAAEESGGELRSAVSQVGDTVWSMHKKKNLARVLMGEMILTFFKEGAKPKQTRPSNGIALGQLVDAVLPTLHMRHNGFHGELLFNRLIVEAWRLNALHTLRFERDDFIRLLETRGWHYDPRLHSWMKGRAVQSQGSLFAD
jgi:16S rRNA G966 N2-methylase RsmD